MDSVRGMTNRFLPGLTGIYSSLSPKQTNSRNADHPLAIEFARTVARVQHAVTDTLFHCSVRGYGDSAFGWSAIIAGEIISGRPMLRHTTWLFGSTTRAMIGSLLDISGAALGAMRVARSNNRLLTQ
jgi:hypothetical protein